MPTSQANIAADDFIDNVPLYEAGELDTLYDELNEPFYRKCEINCPSLKYMHIF